MELFNGRLDRERVAAVLDTLVDPAQVDAGFICGPGPMMDTGEAALRDAGVDPDAILVERFSVRRPAAAEAAAAQEATRAAAGLTIQVTIDGRRRTAAFDAAEGNILERLRRWSAGSPRAQGRRVRHLPR